MAKVILFILLVAAVALLAPPPGTEARTTQKDLLRLFDRVLADVSRIRGLEVKAPIGKAIRTRAQVRSLLKQAVQKGTTPEKIEVERVVMTRLGLIPETIKLDEMVVDLMTEQMAGYYDPAERTFYIADWLPANEQKLVMAHELTHALQDQHYGLTPLLKPVEGNDDATLARDAVLEGDAMVVMLEHLLEPTGRSMTELPNFRLLFNEISEKGSKGNSKVFDSAPLVFQETLLFPYVSGAAFVQTYRKVKTWKHVDRIYADLPQSTEQILHIHKYLGERDAPTEVPSEVPDELKGSEWKQVYRNVLGELGLNIVLRQSHGKVDSERGAKGWDGDCLQLFRHSDGRYALSIKSVWDTPYEASYFFNRYRELVEKKHPRAVREELADSVIWKAAKQRIVLRRSGDRVEALEVDL